MRRDNVGYQGQYLRTVRTISRLKLYLISFAILVALIVFPLLGFLITLDDNASGSKKVQSEDFKTIEKRIKEFTAHLKNNPEDGLAFKRLGELYLKAGRLSEAVSTYVAAEKILPKDPEIRKAFIQLQSMGHATSNR